MGSGGSYVKHIVKPASWRPVMHSAFTPYLFRWHDYSGLGNPGMMKWYGLSWNLNLVSLVLLFFAFIWMAVGLRWYFILGRRYRNKGISASPLDILKTRYAKGEITRDEYRNMKRELNQ